MSSHRYEDIRKILIAKTIVDTGSLQKAARELKVTPSAISQSLHSLEKKLGAPLFLREQGRFVATEKCITLIKKAQPALVALDSLFGESAEPLRIDYLDLGAYESIALSIVEHFVCQLKHDHPQARINMMVGRSSELLKRLRTGELCTALVVETDSMERLRLEEVCCDEFGIFLASRMANKIDNWNFIETLGFGLLSTGSDGLPLYMKKFLKQLGPKPKAAITSDSYEILRKAAASGLAASILPKRVAAKVEGDLVEVTQIDGHPRSEGGKHRIFLASMDRCNEMESKYLAQIARNSFT